MADETPASLETPPGAVVLMKGGKSKILHGPPETPPEGVGTEEHHLASEHFVKERETP